MLVMTFADINLICAFDGPKGINNICRGRRVPRSGKAHG
jgi:hypothetical protein